MGTPTSILVKRVERLNPKVVRVTLDPGPNAGLWHFVPGGFMTFCLPVQQHEADVRVGTHSHVQSPDVIHRSYSLVQGPHDGLPQILVKETTAGLGSRFINRHFSEGMQLMAYPPKGRLFPESWNDDDFHFVLFAAGTGITPLYSIMQHVIDAREGNRVTLFYGNTGLKDILLKDALEAWASHPRVTIKHLLTDGSIDDPLYTGRMDAAKIPLLWNTLLSDMPKRVLVSGPKGMRDGVLQTLLGLGVDPSHIRGEDFNHPPHLESPEVKTCEVVAETKSGTIHMTYDPREEDLLEAMIERGYDVPSSCRGGVCANCRAEILQGEVAVDNSYALTEEERAKGWVLCCQSRPLSDKLHIQFKADL
jgi:ring-1,2-phenylacetyl-CoA epoxidase subunit PaaE